MDDREFWAAVARIDWPQTADEAALRGPRFYEAVTEKLAAERPLAYWEAFRVKAVEKRAALQRRAEEHLDVSDVLEVSDDGFWDLTAHFVGMGREAYDKAMADPHEMADHAVNLRYVENFEYVIPDAEQYPRHTWGIPRSPNRRGVL